MMTTSIKAYADNNNAIKKVKLRRLSRVDETMANIMIKIGEELIVRPQNKKISKTMVE